MSTAAENALAGIRFVAFDVDGVFTDGRFYLSDEGVETKAFCTQDGFGVRRLIEDGCVVAVISGRSSDAVRHRMDELGVEHVIQGCRDKVQAFHDLTGRLGISAETCLFVGDDIPDLPLLRQVGYSVAVANAVAEVREACHYTTNAGGGAGAVREVCDLVLAARREDRSA